METIENHTQNKIRTFLGEYRGTDLIKDISQVLAEELKVDNVIIGCLISKGLQVKTLSFNSYGKELGDLVYNLEYTPCENIVNRKACFYPCNVISLFPKDKELQDLKGESYLGTPVCDKKENAIGLIALIHSSQIKNAEGKIKILTEVAKKISPFIEKYYKEEAATAI